MTARQALGVLTTEGIGDAHQGSGVYVRDFPPVIRSALARSRTRAGAPAPDLVRRCRRPRHQRHHDRQRGPRARADRAAARARWRRQAHQLVRHLPVSMFVRVKFPCKEHEMARTVEEWTDERLNDLAAALQPVPTQVAMLTAGVANLDHVTTQLQPVPAQIAVLVAGMEHLATENRALRSELAAVQRQLIQISWALVAALLGAGAAIVGAVV
jgi:hypothetical protein